MKKNNENIKNTKNNETLKAELADILKEKGYKITQGRISILEIFSKHHIPLKVEDVSKYIKGNKVDVATIYRTLKSFEESEILKRVDLRGDSVYFELNNNHHHHHLVCKKCGDIEDVDICEIDKLNEKVLKNSSKFKVILEHSLEFFGVCKSCNKG